MTKPVITWPFTLLKLIRYTGTKQLHDFVEPMIHAYEALISKAQETKISWIQFDEPYLIHDLSQKEGFPKDKLLFAGIVNGKILMILKFQNTYLKSPIILGDVSRPEPMTVSWSIYAQSLTDHPMKRMLTGPVTILNWSFPRKDISVKESTYQLALAIQDEVLDLEANGIRIIQIDEAALREKLPLRKSDWYCEYLDWAIPAFRLVHSKVKPETQIHTHMCYSEFTDIILAIDDMDADVITFEAHSPRVPSVLEIKTALNKMLDKIEIEKSWANPDCGLKTRGNEETTASLKNLVAAAKELRKTKDF